MSEKHPLTDVKTLRERARQHIKEGAGYRWLQCRQGDGSQAPQ